MQRQKLRVAVVGLQFGGSFPPIYLDHPDIEYVGICDTDQKLLQEYGDKFGIARRYSSLDDVIASGEYDAVHILTPIHSHAKLSIQVMKAGLHCACTVPMATTLEELEELVKVQQETGKKYMMMETSVYTYQCLYVKQLVDEGKIGRIQFLRGAHYQDMEGWPSYWMGLPPMHYATHAVSPLLFLSDSKATTVRCYGSGTMREELQKVYGNPYPVETATFRLDRENLCAEVTRSLFHTARDYIESFCVYGEKSSFEWHMEKELPVLFHMEDTLEDWGRGKAITYERVIPPDFTDRLPKEIAHHASHRVQLDEKHPHLSVIQGGNHHGSHPHLVHEFIRSILEDREPLVNAQTAANWTAAGICAHISAMNNGKEISIPTF